MGEATGEEEEPKSDLGVLRCLKVLGVLIVAAWVGGLPGLLGLLPQDTIVVGLFILIPVAPVAFLVALFGLFTISYADPRGRVICWGVFALSAITLGLFTLGMH